MIAGLSRVRVDGGAWTRRVAGVLGLVVASACGGDKTITPPEVDPLIEPFVGTWVADSVLVTSAGDSTIVVDLVGAGGTLSLNVQGSGGYTLALAYQGNPVTDVGTLEVREGFIISRSASGSPPETLSYTFLSSTRLQLSGMINFPFTSATVTPGTLFTQMSLR